MVLVVGAGVPELYKGVDEANVIDVDVSEYAVTELQKYFPAVLYINENVCDCEVVLEQLLNLTAKFADRVVPVDK